MSGLEQPTASSLYSVKRWLPLGVLVAGLVLFFAFGGQHYVSLELLRRHRGALLAFVAAHGLGAALAYMLAYAAMTAFSLPGGALMTIVGGFLFGAYWGAFYAVLGATVGATLLFLAARTALGAFLAAKAGPFLHKMEAGFKENALSYLFVLRLVPLFPFWLVNLVPALLNVSLRVYLIGTFFGIMPGGFVFALVGSGVGEVLDAGGKPELDIIFRAEVLLPILGLALLALVPVVYKRLKTRAR